MENLRALLYITFSNADNDAISSAEMLLNSASQDPMFCPALIHIILTDENENIKIAASIHLKHFILKNPDILQNFTIEQIITLIVQSPPLVRVHLISILNKLLQFLVHNGYTEQMIERVSNLISSSPTNAFCSVLIIRGLLKLEGIIIQGIGTLDNLSQYFIPFFPIVLQLLQSLNPFDSDNELFFHYVFLTANIFINYCHLEPFDEWMNFLSTFLLTLSNQSNSENSPNSTILHYQPHYPFLDKDAIKLISSLFEIQRTLISPEQLFRLTLSLCTFLSSNPSTQSLSYAFRCLAISLPIPEIWPSLSPYVPSILNLFLRQFVPDETYLPLIEEDLFQFISHYHITVTDVPESHVTTALSKFIYSHSELINLLVQICFQYVSDVSFRNSPLAFGSFLLAGYGLRQEKSEFFSGTFSPNNEFLNSSTYSDGNDESEQEKMICEAIQTIINAILPAINAYFNQFETEKYDISSLYVAGFFGFISSIRNDVYQDSNLLLLCLKPLTNPQSGPIVQYFSAAAATNLLPFFMERDDSNIIRSNISNQLIPIMSTIFEMSHVLNTDSMINTVSLFLKYFQNELIPTAINSVQEVFMLCSQYWNSSDEFMSSQPNSINMCQSIILDFAKLMATQPPEISIPFFEDSARICLELLPQTNPFYRKDLFYLLIFLLKATPELTPSFQQIPMFIASFNDVLTNNPAFESDMDDEIDSHIYQSVLMKYLVLRAPNEMVQPEFMAILVGIADVSASDLLDPDELNCFTLTLQLIFVVLSGSPGSLSVVHHFLEIIDHSENPYLGDAIAAIVTTAPQEGLSEETRVRKWLGAKPAPFLRSVVSVIEQLGLSMLFENQEINETIIRNVIELKKMIEEENMEMYESQNETSHFSDLFNSYNNEQSDIFDLLTLISYFDNYLAENNLLPLQEQIFHEMY